jgi:hypothetical protein
MRILPAFLASLFFGLDVTLGLGLPCVLQGSLTRLCRLSALPAGGAATDDVFGAEFAKEQQETEQVGPDYRSFKPTKTAAELEPVRYWKGKPYRQLQTKGKSRDMVMKSFDNLRVTFLADSAFVAALGLCGFWAFGTYKDVVSFGVGSVLGLGYAVLLGRYVEGIGGGGGQQRGGGAGSARFAPVILLVVLYGKFRTQLSIVPELLGFFSYQLASLLQIFNESAYQDEESDE